MAFKPLRLSDSTTAIASSDPAIDRDATGQEAFAEYEKQSLKQPSCWRDLVKIKSGEQPSIFTIGVIPPDEMAKILDEASMAKGQGTRINEMFWRCFLVGLRDVQNWPGKPEKRSVGGIEYVSPEWIKSQFIRGLRDVAQDIGSQIFYWNRLTDEEIKN